MLRRLDHPPADPNGHDCVRPLKSLDMPGFMISEARYDAAGVIPAQPHTWASLCLVVGGGYRIEWGRTRLNCGPASLVFLAPGEVYGVRVSDAGSHCVTVAIDPSELESTVGTPDFERLHATRRPPPHWLAFELRRELELRDELSSTSVASTVAALLVELGDGHGFDARSVPPPWLVRVQEQIEDEFRQHHTLKSLSRAAGVHHVHLAREFRRRFGCTVGHYIRQRRVEFGCHQLTVSRAPLSEIAVDAGFADQSHFTNTFRRLVGISPGVFRARFFAPTPQLLA